MNVCTQLFHGIFSAMTKNVLAIGVCLVVVISGCSFWDNSTTYFNTYYNAKKLMNETEEEFGYHDEIVKPPAPRVVVPQEPDIVLEKKTGELPKYLKDFQIKPEKLQPVQVKVDSIIIKGSKILAIHPKSSFIDGTLFLMAQAFFYRSEWLPANIKCQELIEQFPNSSYSPDAHLLSSKSYLMQQNIPKANTMLSRTVDVAWQQKRYDVLAEAFRLQAETALDQQDVDAAERPYRQAIVQTDDNVLKARWQNELGLLLYRLGKFERAEKELAKVQSFDPEPVYDYESRVYRAAALMRTKRYTESAAMLDELEKSRKFDDYNKMGFITAERMNWLRITGNNDSLKKMEMYADTANVNSSAVLAANFQTGMKLYREKDYTNARKYFAKARTKRTPVFDGASLLFSLLNQREEKQMTANLYELRLATPDSTTNRDSLKTALAHVIFELGRVHEQLGNADSATKWYLYAADIAPVADTARAQYLYNYARMIDSANSESADSIHQIIFDKYKRTQYGKVSQVRLGYTNYAIADTVRDVFESGMHLRKIGSYDIAMRQFHRVADEYPQSKYAPQATYLIGWIWQEQWKNRDSALFYFSRLVRYYQESEYAKEVYYAVVYATTNNTKDSVAKPYDKPNNDSKDSTKHGELQQQPNQQPMQPDQIRDILKRGGFQRPNNPVSMNPIAVPNENQVSSPPPPQGSNADTVKPGNKPMPQDTSGKKPK